MTVLPVPCFQLKGFPPPPFFARTAEKGGGEEGGSAAIPWVAALREDAEAWEVRTWKKEQLERSSGLEAERQGQNLDLTVLPVPCFQPKCPKNVVVVVPSSLGPRWRGKRGYPVGRGAPPGRRGLGGTDMAHV